MTTIKSSNRNFNVDDFQQLSNDKMGLLVGGEDTSTVVSTSAAVSNTGDGTTSIDPVIFIKK